MGSKICPLKKKKKWLDVEGWDVWLNTISLATCTTTIKDGRFALFREKKKKKSEGKQRGKGNG